MTEPIDELLEWLHTFDELQFSCNHRNVIEKIWQIKSKQQFDIHSVVKPLPSKNALTVKAYSDARNYNINNKKVDIMAYACGFIDGGEYVKSELK